MTTYIGNGSANWGGGIKGATGGALAGSAIMPGLGTLIGGGLGFLGGMFGGGPNENDAKNRQMLMDYYNTVNGRQAPQAGPASQSAYSGFRANQSNLISRLEALASGQGPSLATQQFKEATDRNQAAQASMANSGRGGPLAALTAQSNMGLLGAQAAQGSAAGRIQEQQMALQQLGANIGAGRQADESTNMFNTGQTNATALANLDARLRAMQLDDNTRLQILAQLGGQNQAEANRPGLGDQILAGGAGAYSMFAGNQAQKNNNATAATPSAGRLPWGGWAQNLRNATPQDQGVTSPGQLPGWQGLPGVPQRY